MRSYMDELFSFLMQLKRRRKVMIAICVDVSLLCCAFWAAFFIRMETLWVFDEPRYVSVVLLVCLTYIATFFQLGLYHTLLRFISFHGFGMIAIGAIYASSLFVVLGYFFQIFMPRSVPFLFALIFFVLASGVRFLVRYLYFFTLSRDAQRVILFGSEQACMYIVRSLIWSEKYKVSGIFSDDLEPGSIIQGIKVYALASMEKFIERYRPQYLLLVDEQLNQVQKSFLFSLLNKHNIELRYIPHVEKNTKQYISFEASETITIEHLMNRGTISGSHESMCTHLKGRSILITGAGGSIGSEICRQVITYKPQKIILFELSEFSLFSILNELEKKIKILNITCEIIPILGNIQDAQLIEKYLQIHDIDIIYHAAAYKHVDLVERNPLEAIKNNIFGTWNVARLASVSQVSQCVLISSDKAVKPSSLMGATKRVSEMIIQYFAEKHSSCLFNSVRFGNVIGSSGSVVPLFQAQINTGGPVTVTHPDVERFFMTITEASHLVIQASTLATQQGEIFVLDMGKPVKILDLAKKMIRLSGRTLRSQEYPNGEIEIIYTGLKKGEKLKEELFDSSRVRQTTHPKIKCTLEKDVDSASFVSWINELKRVCDEGNTQLALDLIRERNDLIRSKKDTNEFEGSTCLQINAIS